MTMSYTAMQRPSHSRGPDASPSGSRIPIPPSMSAPSSKTRTPKGPHQQQQSQRVNSTSFRVSTALPSPVGRPTNDSLSFAPKANPFPGPQKSPVYQHLRHPGYASAIRRPPASYLPSPASASTSPASSPISTPASPPTVGRSMSQHPSKDDRERLGDSARRPPLTLMRKSQAGSVFLSKKGPLADLTESSPSRSLPTASAGSPASNRSRLSLEPAAPYHPNAHLSPKLSSGKGPDGTRMEPEPVQPPSPATLARHMVHKDSGNPSEDDKVVKAQSLTPIRLSFGRPRASEEASASKSAARDSEEKPKQRRARVFSSQSVDSAIETLSKSGSDPSEAPSLSTSQRTVSGPAKLSAKLKSAWSPRVKQGHETFLSRKSSIGKFHASSDGQQSRSRENSFGSNGKRNFLGRRSTEKRLDIQTIGKPFGFERIESGPAFSAMHALQSDLRTNYDTVGKSPRGSEESNISVNDSIKGGRAIQLDSISEPFLMPGDGKPQCSDSRPIHFPRPRSRSNEHTSRTAQYHSGRVAFLRTSASFAVRPSTRIPLSATSLDLTVKAASQLVEELNAPDEGQKSKPRPIHVGEERPVKLNIDTSPSALAPSPLKPGAFLASTETRLSSLKPESPREPSWTQQPQGLVSQDGTSSNEHYPEKEVKDFFSPRSAAGKFDMHSNALGLCGELAILSPLPFNTTADVFGPTAASFFSGTEGSPTTSLEDDEEDNEVDLSRSPSTTDEASTFLATPSGAASTPLSPDFSLHEPGNKVTLPVSSSKKYSFIPVTPTKRGTTSNTAEELEGRVNQTLAAQGRGCADFISSPADSNREWPDVYELSSVEGSVDGHSVDLESEFDAAETRSMSFSSSATWGFMPAYLDAYAEDTSWDDMATSADPRNAAKALDNALSHSDVRTQRTRNLGSAADPIVPQAATNIAESRTLLEETLELDVDLVIQGIDVEKGLNGSETYKLRWKVIVKGQQQRSGLPGKDNHFSKVVDGSSTYPVDGSQKHSLRGSSARSDKRVSFPQESKAPSKGFAHKGTPFPALHALEDISEPNLSDFELQQVQAQVQAEAAANLVWAFRSPHGRTASQPNLDDPHATPAKADNQLGSSGRIKVSPERSPNFLPKPLLLSRSVATRQDEFERCTPLQIGKKSSPAFMSLTSPIMASGSRERSRTLTPRPMDGHSESRSPFTPGSTIGYRSARRCRNAASTNYIKPNSHSSVTSTECSSLDLDETPVPRGRSEDMISNVTPPSQLLSASSSLAEVTNMA
ncbi:hypothetical protein IE53DRAFT_411176 [Violaceomyces palustris]|uniref:Uncharacterized protein n=1 Tax=Violaceomyces palustris TaxID=1673888 RepID=A0ACD0NWG6_9BASI|nr:hypothetical protein IE53DRAFT_411176 [Violaceomyces palustris]